MARRPKPDPEKTYRPLQPVSLGDHGVFNPSNRLRGDHPAVIAAPEHFIHADASDAEVAAALEPMRRHSERVIRTERARQRAAAPPPPPSTVMICVADHTAAGREWVRGERLLDKHPAVLARPDAWAALDEILPPREQAA